MKAMRTCESPGRNEPFSGSLYPRVSAPDRIDKQALFAALVRAGQPLCVEHAIRMRWTAAQAREKPTRVSSLGRRLTQVAWAAILALAHGIAQVLQ